VPGLEVAAAVAGALAGSALALWLAGSRLRTWTLGVAGLAGWLGVGLVTGFCRNSEVLSSLVGPTAAYRAAELVGWFCLTALTVALLRTLSRRLPAFLALELALAGGILASLFAGHRDGSTNRPYFLVDPLWSQGYDPMPVFFVLGALVAALLLVLAALPSRKRSFLDLGVFLLILALAFLALPVEEIQKQRQEQSQRELNEDSYVEKQRHPANPPVAVVLLGDDYSPPLGTYYFRQTVYSHFNGVRLVRDSSGRFDTDVAPSFPTARLPLAGVFQEPGVHRGLDTTVALLSQHSEPFGLANPVALAPAANPDPRRFQRAYQVHSSVLDLPLEKLLGRQAGAAWDPATRQHYLSYPPDPRYPRLVEEILAPLPRDRRRDPLIRAVAIKLWMDAHTIYSLDTSHNLAEDPVADFLFGDRTGYCVMMSHSATVLYRAAGVPARVAAGYAVDASFRGSGSAILVRAKEAHAWPEIYLDGVGWIPLDITPARSLEPPEAPPDQGLQSMLGDMARQENGHPEQDTRPEVRGPGRDLRHLLTRLGRETLAALPMALALWALVGYAGKLYRRFLPFWCPSDRLPLLAYRAALDRLAEAGLVRGYGQTREEFARAVAEVCPALVPLTALHQDHALGKGRPLPREEVLGLYQAVSRQLARKVPLGRRLAGALQPFSWWRVR
jgi:transglutaminase-like putative cysteine protease